MTSGEVKAAAVAPATAIESSNPSSFKTIFNTVDIHFKSTWYAITKIVIEGY